MNEKEYIDLSKIFDELWPICRSITGRGLRKSLKIIKKYIPLKMHSMKSGTQVFDWKVPLEWEIKDAKLVGPDKKIYCDFNTSNLSIINYSTPIDKNLDLDELENHLYSIPQLPSAIPYITSYYKPNWGFCLPHEIRANLPKGKYHCFIDSKLFKGETNFSDYLLKGGTSDSEILLSSYICHPSLANNELSGPLVLIGLYNKLKKLDRRRFNYRFYIGPETIGSLCFLKKRGKYLVEKLNMGIVLTCLGGKNENLSVKLSRNSSNFINNFIKNEKDLMTRDFNPLGGSDERQYCSPGFNLPVINICRDIYGDYEGYHNSLDTKEFMNIKSIEKSIDRIYKLLIKYEIYAPFKRTNPFGEPQLGKRNLYTNINSYKTWNTSTDTLNDNREMRNAILWILSLADGKHCLYKIHEKSKISFEILEEAVKTLQFNKLIF